MKKKFLQIFIFLICLVTLDFWFLSKSDVSLIFNQPLLSVSQITALLGIVLLSLSLLFSTRLRFLEKAFGGLDKLYDVHHLIGGMGFILAINHPLLLAVGFLPEAKISLLYLFPTADTAYNFGVVGLYAMILSFIFMVFIKVPYHLWKYTHKLLPLAFILLSIHTLLISSDTSSFMPLRIWISGFIAIGVVSSFYILIIYPKFVHRFIYQVEKIERVLDIITIYLKPATKKKIIFFPGQFVYVRFENELIGNESHPFSILSPPDEETIRLSVKVVGDYTLKLANLNPDDRAILQGPYGHFGLKDRKGSNCLWIAGGIGVTPFLSMLSSRLFRPAEGSIHFIYSCRQRENNNFSENIQEITQKIQNVSYLEWYSKEKGRLSVEKLKEQIDLDKIDFVFLCGPTKMMEDLSCQLIAYGVPENNIIFENFNYFS